MKSHKFLPPAVSFLKNRKIRRVSLAAAILPLLVLAQPATAATILFTFTGTASGSLDGTDFTDQEFIIEAVGDTTERQSFSDGFFLINQAASITFPNLNTGGPFVDITDPTTVNVNNTVGVVTFGNDRVQLDLALLFSPSDFQTWDLLSSIGPISVGNGDGFLQEFFETRTNSGDLIFDEDAQAELTFQAQVIPEPGTVGLFLMGAVLLIRRRPKR